MSPLEVMTGTRQDGNVESGGHGEHWERLGDMTTSIHTSLYSPFPTKLLGAQLPTYSLPHERQETQLRHNVNKSECWECFFPRFTTPAMLQNNCSPTSRIYLLITVTGVPQPHFRLLGHGWCFFRTDRVFCCSWFGGSSAIGKSFPHNIFCHRFPWLKQQAADATGFAKSF